jgi:hypothetical protein
MAQPSSTELAWSELSGTCRGGGPVRAVVVFPGGFHVGAV